MKGLIENSFLNDAILKFILFYVLLGIFIINDVQPSCTSKIGSILVVISNRKLFLSFSCSKLQHEKLFF